MGTVLVSCWPFGGHPWDGSSKLAATASLQRPIWVALGEKPRYSCWQEGMCGAAILEHPSGGKWCLLVEPGLCSEVWCWLQGSVHTLSHRNGGCGCPPEHPLHPAEFSHLSILDPAAQVSFPVSVAPPQAQHSKEREKGVGSLWMLWNALTSQAPRRGADGVGCSASQV